jgi:uncharacterized lipoprotein YddW (UPF0748 family)
MSHRLRRLALAGLLLAGLAIPFTPADEAAAVSISDPSTCTGLNPATPKRQFRAMWIASVVNIDWPSTTGLSEAAVKAEYTQWLELAKRLKLNAVVVQIRPTADAFWPSRYEPWSTYLTGVPGQDPGWDPLAFLVAEAHRYNLEFHAWFNPYRVSMPSPGAGPDIDKLAPGAPARAHPDWVVAYPVGTAASRLYYNPGIPEVRRFVQDAVLDAVTRYDVDGVHFDDYFYPYPAAGQDFADDATFAQYGGGFANKGDWRRDNINRLIQEMGQRVHAVKPWVKFGVSPFGIWRNASTDPLGSDTAGLQSYDAIYADTRLWVRNNWIDYLVPQVYWNIGFTVADYAKLVPWWSEVVAGTNVQLYIGQAAYKVAAAGQPAAWFDPLELSRHLTFNRAYPQVVGDVHFSAKDVRADRLGSVTQLAADHYTRPALPPAYGPAQRLLPPIITRAGRDGTLQWIAAGHPASFAVYRFDGLTIPRDWCAFADAAHLVATVRGTSWTDLTAQPGQRYTYFVTALDRGWHESLPSPPRFVR